MRNPFRSQYRITQPFGARPEYYRQFGLRGHEGIDLIPTGSDWTVKCLADGVVVKDEDNRGSGAYGIFVTVWHKEIRKATQYCHLSSNSIRLGQVLKEGDTIGKMGATGNTQGAHLHLNLFEVDDNGIRLNRNNGYFGGIDPLPFLQEGRDQQKIIDGLRTERDRNWRLYLDEQRKLEEKNKVVIDLEERNRRLMAQLEDTKRVAATLSDTIKQMEEEDADALGDKIEAEDKLKEAQITIDTIIQALDLSYNATRKEIVEKIELLKKPQDETIKHYENIINNLWPNLVRHYRQSSFLKKVVEKLLFWFR
jgi:septal ring factor EnvC (AmiA/AmiB activator)